MDFFTTEEFIFEVTKLLKSKSHSDCEIEIINSLFTSSIDEIKNIACTRIGGDANKSPFLRKRIETLNGGKSGGYRLYFWLMIQDEDVFLLFIHPKKGRKSGTNITTEKQMELVKTFKQRENGSFIKIELNGITNKIVYSKDKSSVFN
jgi:hypothetical protein